MNDETLHLWAQWGILNKQNHQRVLEYFGDLKTAWEKITPAFLAQFFEAEKVDRIWEIRKRLDFETMMRSMEDLDIRLLHIDDPDYPEDLCASSDAPPFLFVRGSLPPLHKSLAVVGTRSITDYGRLVTERLTADLVYNGFVIVSGLALGVDTCAHETALRAQGATVAVLGSGVDVIYPATNRPLAQRILSAKGAIVSEYPLGTPAIPHHFPERNRIIAGLSRGTLVTEGGIKSGALITARLALEEGREVFAVPHGITKTQLSGTNHLIRRSEAKLVERASHILEEFQMETAQQSIPFDLSEDEKAILSHLAKGGADLDELSSQSGWKIQRLSELIVQLELKGLVREMGRKWVLS